VYSTLIFYPVVNLPTLAYTPVFGQSGKMLRNYSIKVSKYQPQRLVMLFFGLLGVQALLLGCSHNESKSKPLIAGSSLNCDEKDDWPMFQKDATRRGSRTGDLRRRPEHLWTAYVGVQSWLNNPVITGHHVYVGSSGTEWNQADEKDGVYALELFSGKQSWFFPTKTDANGVAFSRCRIVATVDDGSVYGIDSRSGAQVWKFQAKGKAYTNPLILGASVLVGDSTGGIHMLDLATGKERWKHQMDAAIRGGFSSNGELIFAASETGIVVALDTAGKVRWLLGSEGRGIYGAPTLVGESVLLGFVRDTTYPNPALMALSQDSGTETWNASNPQGLTGGWANIRASVAVSGDLAFWAEAYSDRLVAASVTSGEVQWSAPSGPCFFRQWSSPIVVGDVVLVGRMDGVLHAHDVTSGDAIWEYSLANHTDLGSQDRVWSDQCWHEPENAFPILATPAVSESGVVVVGTEEGYLYAVGIKE
jgi:outer membrane protein assembly factor BamB